MNYVLSIRRLAFIAIVLISSFRSNAQLSANFNADNLSGCAPLIVNFTNTSAGNPTQFTWTLGNGTTSFLKDPTTTYFNPGSYNVKLVIKTASGADSMIKDHFITVFANPTVAFSLSDSLGCYPKTVQFTDKCLAGSGNITSWTWDFGDGNISNQQNPAHTYTNAGNYSVTLKVVNAMGCQKTVTKANVVRLQNPVAAYSFSSPSGCNASLNISFSNQSTGVSSYKWSFGDGNVSTQQNPTYTYAAAGTYNVKLVITGVNGCKDSVTKNIAIGTIKANFDYTAVCLGLETIFQNTSFPSPVSAAWDFGDGTTSTDIDPIIKFLTAGNHQVKLVTDFGGCKDSVIKTVVVHPKPTAQFAYTGERFKCQPTTTINFNALETDATYRWDFGDGNTSTLKSPTNTYTSYGSYNVQLIVINATGCTDTFTAISFVQIQKPIITGITGLFEGCTPHQASFTPLVSSSDNVISWSWDLGEGGATSNLQQATHLYSHPGMYDVTIRIVTSGGCIDSFTQTSAIQISNKPTAAFIASPLATCGGGPVKFTNHSVGAFNYLWLFGDGGTSAAIEPNYLYQDTGIFSVTLIASSTGCKDTLKIDNYVRNDPPIAKFNVLRDCSHPYDIQFRDTSLGAQSYLWRFGDGDSSTLQHPKHTYAAKGVYEFSLTVFHGSCSYIRTGSLVIIDEHPRLTVTDTAICRGGKIIFNATNIDTANIVGYRWEYGDAIVHSGIETHADHNFNLIGQYYPLLTTMDKLGCIDTAIGNIELNVYGAFAKFGNIAGVCLGTTAVFNDSSSSDATHPITQWTWDYGDGNPQSYNAAPFSHLYATSGTKTIQLKVTNSFGCVDSIQKTATITIADPVAAFVASDTIKCSANIISYNNLSEGEGLQYAWSLGESASSTVINTSHSYTTSGQHSVKLVITDVYGCKDSATKQVIISNPFASFLASDSFASCPPLLVNLNNQSSSFSNIHWDFGDGSVAGINDPSHYYTYPGTYQLKLKAQGFGDCIDSATKTIIIKGPTGSFVFTPKIVCTNAPVQFNASTGINADMLWDFSDGSTNLTTSTVVSHGYEVPGFYHPRMILIDTAGCEVAITSPDTVKVLGVNARIGFDRMLFCDTAFIQFKDSSSVHNDLPAHYQWTFGDGTSSILANPLHLYTTTGNYTTKLVITSSAGCIDSAILSSPIAIFRSPEIAINSNPFICMHDTMQFNGIIIQSDTTVQQWNWNFSNGHNSNLQNPSQSFDTDGGFNITVIATSSNGCSDTTMKNILVHPLPNVKAGTDTMICRGQTYSLQPTGAASYEWRSDISLSCTSCSSPVVNPFFGTRYHVTGTSQFGCKAADSVYITVQQPIVMSVSKDDSLCKGTAIQLKANGAANYSWSPALGLNNASIGNPLANPAVTTLYTVVGTDPRNCFNDTGYVKISVFPVPQFNIFESAITLPAGTDMKIATSNSPDITKWKWTPSKDLSCADCPQPVATAKDNIKYRAEVKNNGGCTTADEITITVICNDGNVFIPNTFSPNNDGMNDVFYPRGKGITSVKNMKIFDRWGELIFERSNFSANDAAAGWDGSHKGTKLTPDVYVYIVDVVCNNSTVFTLKGNVTLIR